MFIILSPLVKIVPRRLLEAPGLARLSQSLAPGTDLTTISVRVRLTQSGGEGVRPPLESLQAELVRGWVLQGMGA